MYVVEGKILKGDAREGEPAYHPEIGLSRARV
jgi:hypothetical protein